MERIRNEFSLHAEEDPSKCPGGDHRRGVARVVDCCGVEDERDIVECSSCGAQKSVPCFFDEEYS